MNEAVIVFVGAVVWLGLGGWAYGTIIRENDDKMTPEAAAMLFGMCVVFGPFVAGAASTLKRKDRTP